MLPPLSKEQCIFLKVFRYHMLKEKADELVPKTCLTEKKIGRLSISAKEIKING